MSPEERIAKLEQQLKLALDTIDSLSAKVDSLQGTIEYRGSLDKLGTEIWTEKHAKIDIKMADMIQRMNKITERIDSMEYNINMSVPCPN